MTGCAGDDDLPHFLGSAFWVVVGGVGLGNDEKPLDDAG